MASSEIWYLENIIDYAGTFPPAALPLSESWRNYIHYRGGDQSWILGSIVLACSVLDDVSAFTNVTDEIEIAVVGRPSNSWETWLEARDADIAQMKKAFSSDAGIVAAAYESKIADLSRMGDALAKLKPISKEVDIYLELPWEHPIDDALAEIASSEWARVKFRTGGLMKESFPTCDQLASAIKSCVDLEIEFKLTAGLHEPIAHIDKETGAFAHGFLNVLGATAIAFSDDASVAEISEVLAMDNPKDWKIGKGLTFGDRTLGEDELNDARSFFGSFGSCSIDEPLDGLGRLTRG